MTIEGVQEMNQDQVQNLGDKCAELEIIQDHLCTSYLVAQRRSFGILCHLIQIAIEQTDDEIMKLSETTKH